MNDEQDRTREHEKSRKSPGLIARAKTLYQEKPTAFAFGVMGISALAFVCGGLLLGDWNPGVLMTPDVP